MGVAVLGPESLVVLLRPELFIGAADGGHTVHDKSRSSLAARATSPSTCGVNSKTAWSPLNGTSGDQVKRSSYPERLRPPIRARAAQTSLARVGLVAR